MRYSYHSVLQSALQFLSAQLLILQMCLVVNGVLFSTESPRHEMINPIIATQQLHNPPPRGLLRGYLFRVHVEALFGIIFSLVRFRFHLTRFKESDRH